MNFCEARCIKVMFCMRMQSISGAEVVVLAPQVIPRSTAHGIASLEAGIVKVYPATALADESSSLSSLSMMVNSSS